MPKMIINVVDADRTPGQANTFRFVSNAQELGATHDSYSFDGDIIVEGEVTGTGLSYRVLGTISCTKSFDCDHCLEHTVQEQVHEFREDFRQGSEADDPKSLQGEREFSMNDSEDVSYFSGETIDLAPLVRDTLLAAQPLSNVCREDCKGLCLVCGANLNQGDCGCDRFIPDPRLAALKDFFKNS